MGVRPRDTGWFTAKPSLDGEFHWLVDAETFERLTGRQTRGEDEGRREGEYRLYPEMLAAAFREGGRCEMRLQVRAVKP